MDQYTRPAIMYIYDGRVSATKDGKNKIKLSVIINLLIRKLLISVNNKYKLMCVLILRETELQKEKINNRTIKRENQQK